MIVLHKYSSCQKKKYIILLFTEYQAGGGIKTQLTALAGRRISADSHSSTQLWYKLRIEHVTSAEEGDKICIIRLNKTYIRHDNTTCEKCVQIKQT